MIDTHKKKRMIMILFSLFLTTASIGIIFAISHIQKKESIRHAGYVMAGEINKLQYTIDSHLLNAEILEMIVVNDQGVVENFDETAKKLFANDPSIRSLQLAPDGVVTYVYPLEGNEDAFGDLFSDPDRKTEAEYARDTGEMTLAGPFELAQGGMGIVARQPIYLTDSRGKNSFWGFSIVIMDTPDIFETTDLESLSSQGYNYRIWRIHPDTQKVQVIVENTSEELSDTIDETIQVPGGTWTLSLTQKGGWVPVHFLVIEGIVALIIVLLMILVFHNILTILHQKTELSRQANTDQLTGLHNDRFFTVMTKKLVADSTPFVLFYLDLDKFKLINDQYGHDVGDKLLKETAARIKSCIREQDLASRIGGDEFTVIVLHEFVPDFFDTLSRRMLETISRDFTCDGIRIVPKASIGYAAFPYEEKELEKLIRLADQRMYSFKKKV